MVLLPGIKSTLDKQHPLAGQTNFSADVNTSLVECHPDAESEAIIVLSLAALGAVANLSLMGLIIIRNNLRRYPRPLKWWNQGLVFHQGLVDLLRSLLLLPIGLSLLSCTPIHSCSIL